MITSKDTLKQTRIELAERVRPMADRLVEQLVDMTIVNLERNLASLTESFEAALSAFGSDLEEVTPKKFRQPAARKQLAPATGKAASSASGKSGPRRNHCKSCGAEGFQTKTCGITHDANGALHVRSAGRDASPRKSKARAVEVADEEAAPVPTPARVLADQPPPPKDPPRGAATAKPQVVIPPRPPALPRPTSTFAVSNMYEETRTEKLDPTFTAPKVKPKKTAPREKALAEIRAENLRKAVAARAKKAVDEEPDTGPIARVGVDDDEDDDEFPVAMSEGEASRLEVIPVD